MTRRQKLRGFVRFLEETEGFQFDISKFDHRIFLQKYVFLARYFGWNHGYSYNLYIRGPYSRDLAAEYYQLPEEGNVSNLMQNGFDGDGFSDLIHGKRLEWLEAATTMLSLKESYEKTCSGETLKRTLIQRTEDIKKGIPPEVIQAAYAELSSAGIL